MALVKPPCTRNCPRRTQHCHNPDICPDWKIYQAAKAKQDAAIKSGQADQRQFEFYLKERAKDVRNVRRKET